MQNETAKQQPKQGTASRPVISQQGTAAKGKGKAETKEDDFPNEDEAARNIKKRKRRKNVLDDDELGFEQRYFDL